MARKKSEPTKHFFDSWGNVITTIIVAASTCIGIGYYFGRNEVIHSYEDEIEDLKFRQLQMQIDFQNSLVEEKLKWSKEVFNISIEEYKELLQTPITTKDGKEE